MMALDNSTVLCSSDNALATEVDGEMVSIGSKPVNITGSTRSVARSAGLDQPCRVATCAPGCRPISTATPKRSST